MPTAALRVLCVCGTRPDAVKTAPVVLEMQRRGRPFVVRTVVTGQHREQLDQALAAFGIEPDCDLRIMRPEQSLADVTVRALEGLDKYLRGRPADVCLAQGDTTSTFVAALAAFYHKVPFGHIEAGLRTGDRYQPFPEEMNRRLAAGLATWHFAPTAQARANLLAEGIDAPAIYVTGNTGIDALRIIAARPLPCVSAELREIMESERRIVLVTAHRRENWGEPMDRIGRALAGIAREFDDCEIVVALHKNPVVRNALSAVLAGVDRVRLIEPPDYAPFVKLMQRATLILTDSGGVQEEAPTLGVPVLVLRNTTERQEGVEAGAATLVGTETDAIVEAARRLLTDGAAWDAMARAVNPYGDGHAAERICDVLAATMVH